MDIIKGKDLMVFLNQKSVAFATNHTLAVTGDTLDVTSKDHGKNGAVEVSKYSWEMTTENLYTADAYESLFDAMLTSNPVELYFGICEDSQNKMDGIVDTDENYWKRPDSCLKGYAYITSIEANAQNGENATFSVTFTGASKIYPFTAYWYIDVTCSSSVVATINGVTTTLLAGTTKVEKPYQFVVTSNAAGITGFEVSDNGWFYMSDLKLEGASGLTSIDLSHVQPTWTDTLNHHVCELQNLTSMGDISDWDMTGMEKITGAFWNNYYVTSYGDLGKWRFNNLLDARGMFYNNYSLTEIGNLSGWDMSNVARTELMFAMTDNLKGIEGLRNWKTGNVTTMRRMFYWSGIEKIDVSNLDTSNVTNMQEMFCCTPNLKSIGDISNWDVSKVQNFYLFMSGNNKPNPTTDFGNLADWDTSSATNMAGMFQHNYVERLELDSWDVSNVTTLQCMFNMCSNLETVGNLEKWNTSKVANMEGAFSDCPKLQDLNLSGWDLTNVTTTVNMFTGCTRLAGLELGEGWGKSKVALTLELNYLNQLGNYECAAWHLSDRFWKSLDTLPDRTGKPTMTLQFSTMHKANYDGWDAMVAKLTAKNYTVTAV